MSNAKGFGTNNSNGNGKQATVQPQPQTQPQQNLNSQEFSGDNLTPAQRAVAAMERQAQLGIEGLKRAELNHAANAIGRQKAQFDEDSQQIADALEFYMSPNAKVANGYLIALQRVSDSVNGGLKLPFGGYQTFLPEIPELPGFSQFYSQSSQSAPRLAASPNTNEQNAQNNESIEQPHL